MEQKAWLRLKRSVTRYFRVTSKRPANNLPRVVDSCCFAANVATKGTQVSHCAVLPEESALSPIASLGKAHDLPQVVNT